MALAIAFGVRNTGYAIRARELRAAVTERKRQIGRIFNQVKSKEFLPYESAEDLDLVLEFISKRHSEGRDTSEEDVSSLWNKPKGDVGTFYLLENLYLLNVLIVTSSGHGPGTVRYDLSPSYLNQNSPRLDLLPDDEKFDEKFQQLPIGQKELIEWIQSRSESKQDTSLADAALRHPQEGDVATYRRLENLRLLGFLSITDVGTSRETIRYNLSLQYQKYINDNESIGYDLQPLDVVVAKITFDYEPEPPQQLEFETVTVNSSGQVIKTEPHRASYYEEPLGDNIQPLIMMAIPEGEFIMGSPKTEPQRSERESPQHQVKVAPFWLAQTPITNAQWNFVANLPRIQRKLNPKDSNSEDEHPVTDVSWYDAIEFCARLSRHTDRDYRLPSEAEWEYACRAVNTQQSSVNNEELTVEAWNQQYNQPFHFGATITSELANYNAISTYADEPAGEYREKTVPVKSFSPNGFGLYDMHGQVWEWCADSWHDDYRNAPNDSRVWDERNDNENYYQNLADNLAELLKDDRLRVQRGGSWNYNPRNCRSAYRSRFNPDFRNGLFGFRVACGGARIL
jgi:formylglycine-generating enzyme required for sulfatase activity